MTPAITDWIPGDQKPTIVGVYERCWSVGDHFSYPFYKWDGKCWRGMGATLPCDATASNNISAMQDRPWRGLASDPKDTK